MSNEQSHNPERDSVLEQKAREYELSLVGEDLERYSFEALKNLSDPGLIFTPAEHKMFGSSSYGLGFSPNKPYAVFAKNSLTNINQKREELNKEDRQLPMPINVGGILLLPVVKLLLLEEGVVGKETPRNTFKINHFTDFSGNVVDVDETKKFRAEEELIEMLCKAQKHEQELYFKKINV